MKISAPGNIPFHKRKRQNNFLIYIFFYTQQSSYDGTSSYDYSGASNNGSAVGSCRLPPNAPDDLKVAPPSMYVFKIVNIIIYFH